MLLVDLHTPHCPGQIPFCGRLSADRFPPAATRSGVWRRISCTCTKYRSRGERIGLPLVPWHSTTRSFMCRPMRTATLLYVLHIANHCDEVAVVTSRGLLRFGACHQEVKQYPIRDSNRLIEEFMLLANFLTAQHLILHAGKRAVLRRHPPPSVDKMANVRGALRAVMGASR